MNESWIQALAIIGSNLVIMLTFFGVTISLHKDTRDEIRGMAKEMQDFHGRLEKLDAEFKAHWIYGHGGKDAK